MKYISSRDNPFFKTLLKLSASAAERKKQGLTIIDGVHLLLGYQEKFNLLDGVVVSEKGIKHFEIKNWLDAHPEVAITVLSDALFNEISDLTTPAGIMAVVPIPRQQSYKGEDSFCLACEDIQDPGNLGTILRTAAAAGVESVLLSSGCVSAWSPKVLRSSQGAHFSLNIYEAVDLISASQSYKGKVIGTSPTAELNVFDVDMKGAVMLIVGNEGNGLSIDLMNCATHKVHIPMPGKIESLNVAIATSICLFERVRQIF